MKPNVINVLFAKRDGEVVVLPNRLSRRERFLRWFFNTDWLWTCAEDPRTESPRWFARPLSWFVFRFIYRSDHEHRT